MHFTLRILLLLLIATAAPLARAEDEPLPLPRFASFKSDEVNMRAGPGVTYPIKWVYHRKGLPVEIIEEYEHWRKIRDKDGETGWVHKGLLSGQRSVMLTGKSVLTLHRFPEKDAPAVFKAQPGVIAKIARCNHTWCYLVMDGRKGWLQKTAMFGVYDDEKIDE